MREVYGDSLKAVYDKSSGTAPFKAGLDLVDGYIYSVNLLSFTDTTPIYLAIYWIVFIVLIALGIAKLMCVCFEKESWSNIITKCSLVLSTLFICFFAAARQPYVTALMFLLFVAKIFVWIKQTQTK